LGQDNRRKYPVCGRGTHACNRAVCRGRSKTRTDGTTLAWPAETGAVVTSAGLVVPADATKPRKTPRQRPRESALRRANSREAPHDAHSDTTSALGIDSRGFFNGILGLRTGTDKSRSCWSFPRTAPSPPPQQSPP